MNNSLEYAFEDRNRLYRQYLASKRAEREALYKDPEYGDRLRKFIATLAHYKEPDHAQRMLAHVGAEARKWLAAAPLNIRYAALEAIDHRCQTIRIRAGLNPIDDPVPGEPDNVYRACKGMLWL